MTRVRGGVLCALAAGTAGLLASIAASLAPIEIRVGTTAWRRLVRGPSWEGVLHPAAAASIYLPGARGSRGREVVLEGATLRGGTAVLEVTGAGDAPLLVGLSPRQPARIPIASGRDAVRLDLRTERGTDVPRLEALRLHGGPVPLGRVAVVAMGAALAAALGLAAAPLRRKRAAALAAIAAGLAALLAASPVAWLACLAGGSPGLLPALGLILSGVVLGLAPRVGRRRFALAAGVAAAVIAGAAVRWLFLTSDGSWDTEYWKAWTVHAEEAGVLHAYGPGGETTTDALRQARGEEELWKVETGGRGFTIDYPPLALVLWVASHRLVAGVAPHLAPADALDAAVKLPAILGDVAAVAAIAYLLRDRPRRAIRRAALYWIFPASWLSSAVLGFLDGALAPLVLVALAAAGRQRARTAGAWLALAALVKPTALLVAPAIGVALGSWRAAGRAALTAIAVVAAVLVPFAGAGTLLTTIVHVSRIFFQERLSGGYANAWWIAGWALSGGGFGPVPYVRIDALPLARPLGAILFLLAAAAFAMTLRRTREAAPAVACGAALVVAYALAAVGVHVNHPHAFVLLFIATGMGGHGWRAASWVVCTSAALDMLLLEGLGRLHGLDRAWLEPFGRRAADARMAMGFDATLLLAVANTAAFAILLWRRRTGIGEAR